MKKPPVYGISSVRFLKILPESSYLILRTITEGIEPRDQGNLRFFLQSVLDCVPRAEILGRIPRKSHIPAHTATHTVTPDCDRALVRSCNSLLGYL